MQIFGDSKTKNQELLAGAYRSSLGEILTFQKVIELPHSQSCSDKSNTCCAVPSRQFRPLHVLCSSHSRTVLPSATRAPATAVHVGLIGYHGLGASGSLQEWFFCLSRRSCTVWGLCWHSRTKGSRNLGFFRLSGFEGAIVFWLWRFSVRMCLRV